MNTEISKSNLFVNVKRKKYGSEEGCASLLKDWDLGLSEDRKIL
jgi:hypothetical protein